MNRNNPGTYSVAIVGSGVACTATLLHLLENIGARVESHHDHVHIAVIEKDGEFWKGIPYGRRTSLKCLTITRLSEFIPLSEKEAFINWLEKTLDTWIAVLKTDASESALLWLENNQALIDQRRWDEIYIPRQLFGDYLSQRILAAIDKATKNKTATVELIHAEATDINHNGRSYDIVLESPEGKIAQVRAGKVVLCIGSPPIKSIRPSSTEDKRYTYINDTYAPSLDENLEKIVEVLQAIPDPSKRNIVVLGSNASSIELLYLIQTNQAIKKWLNKIVLISHSGELPHRISPVNDSMYEFRHLAQLKNAGVFTASVLMENIEKDIRIIVANGISVGDAYHQLSDLVVELLNKLDDGEKEQFYTVHGMPFSKLVRKAGAEYYDAAQLLQQAGKLDMVKGSFRKFELRDGQDEGAYAIYADGEKNKLSTYPLAFPLIINCGGFEELHLSSSRLIHNLVNKKICLINATNRGFEVNENFEAAEGLYVMGPLLGGVFNKRTRAWHLENAKGIYNLAKLLAPVIADALLAIAQVDVSNIV